MPATGFVPGDADVGIKRNAAMGSAMAESRQRRHQESRPNGADGKGRKTRDVRNSRGGCRDATPRLNIPVRMRAMVRDSAPDGTKGYLPPVQSPMREPVRSNRQPVLGNRSLPNGKPHESSTRACDSVRERPLIPAAGTARTLYWAGCMVALRPARPSRERKPSP
jgi:hypothetical protein